MDDNMDQVGNDHITDNPDNPASEHHPSEETPSCGRPSLSQVRKSWGFRRTTIARREFLDEIGDLAHSPPLVRKTRTRRSTQVTPASQQTDSERVTPTTRSVLDDLEWSAPSSPASEDSKPPDAPSGSCFDPSLWQDFGSAFHTAFSLLGGGEGLSLETSDVLAVPVVLETNDTIEVNPPPAPDETETPDNSELTADAEVLQPESPGVVAGGETDDVVLISSQDGDGDEMTLLQIKQQLESKAGKGNMRPGGGKGGRGRAKGKGRGRGRGRRKGKRKGKAVELQSGAPDEEDSNDDVILVGPVEEQLEQNLQEGNVNSPPGAAETEGSPAQRSIADCIYIESDVDQNPDAAAGQWDDAPEELELQEEIHEGVGERSRLSETKLPDSNALCCVCQQERNERFLISCDSCQKWLHGSCVGISEVVTDGQPYVCPPCTDKEQIQQHPDPDPDPNPDPDPDCQPKSESEPSIPECLTLNNSGEQEECQENQQADKQPVLLVDEEAAKPEPEAETETDDSSPLCIGPSCSKKALSGSVYCGSDCILHHAAFTMKTLSVPKVLKSKRLSQRKAGSASPTAQGQRSVRTSKRLSMKAALEAEEKKKKEEDDGGQEETACPPSLTEAEAASPPSSQFNTACMYSLLVHNQLTQQSTHRRKRNPLRDLIWSSLFEPWHHKNTLTYKLRHTSGVTDG
ncbi:death-inducer obliterator 1 isoform X3 [Antennarius striatus]|uniref:death-inducer obliterator 1 isoform X3 n=1 Tax=Antennarius striatus TaxID=241820 RepID=UPI0035AF7BAE